MALRKKTIKNTVVSLTMAGIIASSSIQANAALGDRPLVRGTSHADVKELQQHLKDLGYFTYKTTTTYYGDITYQAVRDFQRANRISVDGSFGPESYRTLQKVLSGSSGSSNSGSNGQLAYNRALRLGLSGKDVNELQEALKGLGYLVINNTTDYFGTMTQKAVMDFQRANGLAVDGSFGPASHRKMNDILAGKTSDGGSSNEKPSNPGNNVGQLVYNRALRLGLSGRDVNELQEALKSLGYLVINNTTDYFGTMTRQAVMDFQRANGLAVDGSFGPASHRKMNDILAGKSPSNPDKGDENRRALTVKIIATAKKYLGVPYEFGGSSPSAFDCSGYTQYVYRQYGINIPRTSLDQARVGSQISRSNLQAGDLIIFSDTYRPGPSHTGIYLGDNEFIHASSSGGVVISNLNSSYYSSHFSYGRRIY